MSSQRSSEPAQIRLWCGFVATGFNYFVRIPTPSLDVRFSDNYFDLRDGELAEIAVRGLTDDIGDDQLRAVSGVLR